MFEADEKWHDPIAATFSEWKNKVVVINRYVADESNDKYVTLDECFPNINGKNIFLKMDLEGMGLRAIKGAKKLISNNNCYIAVLRIIQMMSIRIYLIILEITSRSIL